MNNRSIHSLIPLKTILWLLLVMALSIQVVLISYNHFTGFFTINTVTEFFSRFIWGTFLSYIASLFLAYPNLLLIQFYNDRFPWSASGGRRIITQVLFTVLIGLLIGFLLTTASHLIKPYVEDLIRVYVFNMIVVAACNIVLMTIFEAWIFFYQQSEAEKRNNELVRELSEIRFEVLKNQMNPHFMFNSLNVLSSLIEEDVEKSQRFIEEFSNIYRYVLETIEKHVVTLERELEFAHSYMYLQQIRHGDELTWSVEIPSDLLRRYLPPLSLQLVLENAIKHNKIEKGIPFNIMLSVESERLIIMNPLRPKISFNKSTGVGQTNLKKRYAMISKIEPEFKLEKDHFVVSLPLINEEHV
ncbi:MAG TPA: hypothetical protein DCE78_10840 [Bacteroidetes bacterium]|nr:hypothetical protein [Bacteroidota bacterium]